MSSSRRRGRSSGSPATGRPASTVDTAPETVPEAVAVEANENSHTAPPVEAADAATDAVSAAAEAQTDTAAIPEVPAETSPETVQAAVTESVSETAEQAADGVEAVQHEAATTVAETTEAVTEQTAEAVAQVETTVEAVQDRAAEHAAETVDQVAETAMALAAAPLAAAEAVTEAARAPLGGAKAFDGTAGGRFTFIPTFEPLNEINATLLAFARGEGEAAMAHLQALTKVKTPAEAIRLQVSEFQRAADASLTCFSHILRSANRLGGPARWN